LLYSDACGCVIFCLEVVAMSRFGFKMVGELLF